jgi:hypothetical protein
LRISPTLGNISRVISDKIWTTTDECIYKDERSSQQPDCGNSKEYSQSLASFYQVNSIAMVYFIEALLVALSVAGVTARDDFDPRQHLGGNSPYFPGMEITLRRLMMRGLTNVNSS